MSNVLEILQVDNGYIVQIPDKGIISLCQTGEQISNVVGEYYAKDSTKEWAAQLIDVPSGNKFIIHNIGDDYLLQQVISLAPDAGEIQRSYIFKDPDQLQLFFSGAKPSYDLKDMENTPEKIKVCAAILLERDEFLEVWYEEAKDHIVAKVDKSKINVAAGYWSDLFGISVVFEEIEESA